MQASESNKIHELVDIVFAAIESKKAELDNIPNSSNRMVNLQEKRSEAKRLRNLVNEKTASVPFIALFSEVQRLCVMLEKEIKEV